MPAGACGAWGGGEDGRRGMPLPALEGRRVRRGEGAKRVQIQRERSNGPRRQRLQLGADFAPLDLRKPHTLPEAVWLDAGTRLAQREGPAAHVEREMLLQAGQVA